MKKLILMTSALTMIGGAAAAEISFGAETSLTYGNWDTAGGDAVFGHNTTLTGTFSETTASGVSYGASMALEADDGDDGVVSHGTMFVSANGMTLTFGVDAFEEIEDAAEDEAGDIKLEYATGGVSVALVAEAGLGLVGTNDWDLHLGYAAGAFTIGLDTDSSNLTEVAVDYDGGSFTAGVTAATDDSWEVRAGTSFGAINVGVSYDSDDLASLNLDGAAGDVTWALGYNTDEEITASLGYGMGDLSIGLAYDSSNAGGAGDDAETILTVGYAISDMASAQLLANDASEYELSLTLGFAF